MLKLSTVYLVLVQCNNKLHSEQKCKIYVSKTLVFCSVYKLFIGGGNLNIKGIEIYLLLIYISCWVAFYRLINIPIEIGKIWLNDQTSFEKFLQDRYWNEAVDRDLFFISFFNVQWIFHCSQPRLFMSHLRYKLYRIWFTISQG